MLYSVLSLWIWYQFGDSMTPRLFSSESSPIDRTTEWDSRLQRVLFCLNLIFEDIMTPHIFSSELIAKHWVIVIFNIDQSMTLQIFSSGLKSEILWHRISLSLCTLSLNLAEMNGVVQHRHFDHRCSLKNECFLHEMCAAWDVSKIERNLKFKHCVTCIWVNYLILTGRRMVVINWTSCYSTSKIIVRKFNLEIPTFWTFCFKICIFARNVRSSRCAKN